MKLNFVKYNDNILALINVAHKLFLDYSITVFCGAADQGVEEAETDSGALMSNLCMGYTFICIFFSTMNKLQYSRKVTGDTMWRNLQYLTLVI